MGTTEVKQPGPVEVLLITEQKQIRYKRGRISSHKNTYTLLNMFRAKSYFNIAKEKGARELHTLSDKTINYDFDRFRGKDKMPFN